ncbi:PEP-CTERM sorting domain-containing protein [Alienimonas chondri]|uniref:Ice-binding protein C-terminal domain-containing protein n=1 Tax=Alienimonas chondri TaxID=2681879 RepID=A0ABX1VHL6_9PLAN|nr:PEP-CTERM sorting domain-containing protein [Alienimonas chondri]NNJ26961.1 hypothetical protein [Alienimonas chondri]
MLRFALLSAALSTASTPAAFAGFIFAGESNGVDVVAHPIGYDGTGGLLNISVGIDPTSMFANEMMISTQNVVNTFNRMTAVTGNLDTSGTVPFAQFDFESVLLHEMGHSMGLAHVNIGGSSAANEYTFSTDGTNNVFDTNPGADGVIGSADDLRGDDVNLIYFDKATNDPFAIAAVNDPNAIIDSTTYSRDLADLPVGDNYAAQGSRAVAALTGYGDTEAVMQQGTFNGEAQRDFAAQDVAHMRYARSGLDSLQGTADDYTWELTFLGLDTGADIVIDFDNSQTGFAVSQNSGTFLSSNDIGIAASSIFFNSNANWYFNDTPSAVPEPGTTGLLLAALAGALGWRRRFGRTTEAA